MSDLKDWVGGLAAVGSCIAAFLSWRTADRAASTADGAARRAVEDRRRSLVVELRIEATKLRIQSDYAKMKSGEALEKTEQFLYKFHHADSPDYARKARYLGEQANSYSEWMTLAARYCNASAHTLLELSDYDIEQAIASIRSAQSAADALISFSQETKDAIDKHLKR